MRFLRDINLVFFTYIANYLLAFVLNILVARGLGTDGRGVYEISLLTISIAQAVMSLGVGVASLYYIGKKAYSATRPSVERPVHRAGLRRFERPPRPPGGRHLWAAPPRRRFPLLDLPIRRAPLPQLQPRDRLLAGPQSLPGDELAHPHPTRDHDRPAGGRLGLRRAGHHQRPSLLGNRSACRCGRRPPPAGYR